MITKGTNIENSKLHITPCSFILPLFPFPSTNQYLLSSFVFLARDYNELWGYIHDKDGEMS